MTAAIVEIMIKKSFIGSKALFDAVDQWRKKQPIRPTWSMAIRSLLVIALRSEGVKI